MLPKIKTFHSAAAAIPRVLRIKKPKHVPVTMPTMNPIAVGTSVYKKSTMSAPDDTPETKVPAMSLGVEKKKKANCECLPATSQKMSKVIAGKPPKAIRTYPVDAFLATAGRLPEFSPHFGNVVSELRVGTA
jgi:hypothetical protein